MTSLTNKDSMVSGQHTGETGSLTYSELVRGLPEQADDWHFADGAWQIRSLLQPVFCLAQQLMIGVSAELDVLAEDDDVDVSAYFRIAAQDEQQRRLLRAILLSLNHYASLPIKQRGWVEIQVDRALIAAPLFTDILALHLNKLAIPSSSVVIELSQRADWEGKVLATGLKRLQSLGVLISLSEFDARYSNILRVLRLHPHIVRFDPSLIKGVAFDDAAADLIPSVVDMLHQAGCLVLADGIRHVEQALFYLDAEVDLMQGAFFAGSSVQLPEPRTLSTKLLNLSHQLQRQWARQRSQRKRLLNIFTHQFEQATSALARGVDFRYACRGLLMNYRVRRCLLLDEHGLLLEQEMGKAPKLTYLASTTDALAEQLNQWRRQPVRQAQLQPGTLSISSVYRQPCSDEISVTLSWMFTTPAGKRLLCCELKGVL